MSHVGHGSRIRFASRSRLSQTETSVGMSESRPTRRQSDTASVSRLSNPCLRSCCRLWRLRPAVQPLARLASAAAYPAKKLQRLRSFDSLFRSADVDRCWRPYPLSGCRPSWPVRSLRPRMPRSWRSRSNGCGASSRQKLSRTANRDRSDADSAAPVLKTRMEQPAIMSCFIFICLSCSREARTTFERQPTHCLQVPGGYVNLDMFNLKPGLFWRGQLWNRFSEG